MGGCSNGPKGRIIPIRVGSLGQEYPLVSRSSVISARRILFPRGRFGRRERETAWHRCRAMSAVQQPAVSTRYPAWLEDSSSVVPQVTERHPTCDIVVRAACVCMHACMDAWMHGWNAQHCCLIFAGIYHLCSGALPCRRSVASDVDPGSLVCPISGRVRRRQLLAWKAIKRRVAAGCVTEEDDQQLCDLLRSYKVAAAAAPRWAVLTNTQTHRQGAN